ncbi:MAG: hypothetical protein HY710_03130 [Candidatus Latescibacteria bacterium]|nr:hypothetical protein [Candidatus Latescibacterota bacterium]
MLGRKKSRDPEGQTSSTQPEGLARPYGLAVPMTPDPRRSPGVSVSSGALRCPSCGKKIARWWKWIDTVWAWYTGRYRLIRCRRCGTRFAARRKMVTR